ncbi:hypothetical protein V7128_01830 [Neobacillus vireti]|uniref:hypothetical protein n=1 Tax=Neobacillus vireti TaxID=220686 RepID=UPI0030002D1B
MKELVEKVLARTGYPHLEPTESNLISVFLDYTAHGVFNEFTYDQAKQDIEDGDITLKRICYNLLNISN